MMMRLLIVLSILLASLSGAHAHELRPGYLEITQSDEATYDVRWKAPVRLGRPLGVEPQFPADCAAGDKRTKASEGAVIVSTWTIACETPLAGRTLTLPGLESTLTDILIRFQAVDGKLQTIRATPENPFAVIAQTPTAGAVARAYFNLGVEHIFDGIDHLLFVLALVLIITGFRKLIETITAFTLAHSITLAGAALGLLSLPQAPVEAVIALSIVFLASELALKESGHQRMTERYPWVVAFSFGLLHGFGFAGALREIGLPSGDVALALLTFNLGVEAGQLIFVLIVLAGLIALSRVTQRRRVDQIASYAIGVPAAYWLIERIV